MANVTHPTAHEATATPELDPAEATKLGRADAFNKISELKQRQWTITQNCILIFLSLAAIFAGTNTTFSTALVQRTFVAFLSAKAAEYMITIGVFVYFVSVFSQTVENVSKFKKVYTDLTKSIFPQKIRSKYVDSKAQHLFWLTKKLSFTSNSPAENAQQEVFLEDEGRLTWGLFLITLFIFIIVILMIYYSGH
jgi:hypothetical protein